MVDWFFGAIPIRARIGIINKSTKSVFSEGLRHILASSLNDGGGLVDDFGCYDYYYMKLRKRSTIIGIFFFEVVTTWAENPIDKIMNAGRLI